MGPETLFATSSSVRLLMGPHLESRCHRPRLPVCSGGSQRTGARDGNSGGPGEAGRPVPLLSSAPSSVPRDPLATGQPSARRLPARCGARARVPPGKGLPSPPTMAPSPRAPGSPPLPQWPRLLCADLPAWPSCGPSCVRGTRVCVSARVRALVSAGREPSGRAEPSLLSAPPRACGCPGRKDS